MTVIAINGSPRKNFNTATLLQHALDGAASTGAKTELIHLYDLTYTGCTSCFACKLRDGKSYGRCAITDDLTTILEEIPYVEAIILGSPVYFGIVSGMMRCFQERLLFPYLVYANPPQSLFPRKIPSACIYTMNIAEHQVQDLGYGSHFAANEAIMTRMFGQCESLFAYETRQFEDYSKVVFTYLDPAERITLADKQFPIDCKRAYDLGVRLMTQAGSQKE